MQSMVVLAVNRLSDVQLRTSSFLRDHGNFRFISVKAAVCDYRPSTLLKVAVVGLPD